MSIFSGTTCQIRFVGVIAASAIPVVLCAQYPIIERISVRTDGTEADAHSQWPSLDFGGDHVAFASWADLIAGDGYDTSGTCQVYWLDRTTGELQLVSVDDDGVPANANCDRPRVSPGGYDIVFSSRADNLVNGDWNGQEDIFLRNVLTGHTEMITRTNSGEQTNGPSYNPDVTSVPAPVGHPELDGYARYIVYTSEATNLVQSGGTGQRVYRFDRQTLSTVEIDSGSQPTVSGNGVVMAYQSSLNLVSAVTFGGGAWTTIDFTSTARQPTISLEGTMLAWVNPLDQNVYRSPVAMGQSPTRVSVTVDNQYSGGVPGGDFPPAISTTGRYIAFSSSSSHIVERDSNMAMDVFVRDLQRERTVRVSVSADGEQANGPSGDAPWVAISDTGYYVAFASSASNLVPGDTNFEGDIFVVDWTQLPPPPQPLQNALLAALLTSDGVASSLDQNGDGVLDAGDVWTSVKEETWKSFE